MKNYKMSQLVLAGRAIDVSKFKQNDEGDYIFKNILFGVDYCDVDTGEWIQEIVKDIDTDLLLGSPFIKYKGNPRYLVIKERR